MKNFKKILLDLDGTVLSRNGEVSDELIHALNKAKNTISISFCTGRTPDFVLKLAQKIGLQTNHIVDDGSRVIDDNGKELWSVKLPKNVIDYYLDLAEKYHFKIAATIDGQEKLQISYQDQNISRLFPYYLNKDLMQLITTQLIFSDIDVKTAWFDEEKGYNLSITHAEGNKKHGIAFLLQHEHLKKEEAIGVGDEINDIPLFESVGHKVAMGNAINELKQLADEVIPSVDNNGIVYLLKKLDLI